MKEATYQVAQSLNHAMKEATYQVAQSLNQLISLAPQC